MSLIEVRSDGGERRWDAGTVSRTAVRPVKSDETGTPRSAREFRPDEADEALLRFVLASDGDQLHLLHRWRELVELDDASNESHQLLPSAYLRMEQCAPDDRDLGRLRGIYRQRWVTRQRHVIAAERVMHTLATSGVRCLGPADLDTLPVVEAPMVLPLVTPRVCVPERQMRDALDALVDAGWRIRRDESRSSTRQRLIRSEWELEDGTQAGSSVVLGVQFNPAVRDDGFESAVWERSTGDQRGRGRAAPTDLFVTFLTETPRDHQTLRWAIGALALARHINVFPDIESVLTNPAVGHLLPVAASRLDFLTTVDHGLASLERPLEVARSASAERDRRPLRSATFVGRQWMHRSRQVRVLTASVRRHGGLRRTVRYLFASR